MQGEDNKLIELPLPYFLSFKLYENSELFVDIYKKQISTAPQGWVRKNTLKSLVAGKL